MHINQSLTDQPLRISEQNISPYVVGCGSSIGEIIVRQYLYHRLVAGNKLNRAIVLSFSSKNKKVVFPLPKEWRDIIEQHGIKVARLRSSVYWWAYITSALFYGLFKTVVIAITEIKIGIGSQTSLKQYVSFIDLMPSNIPKKNSNKQSHDIISWYLQWAGRKRDIQAVHHNVMNSLSTNVDGVGIMSFEKILPKIVGWSAFVKYIVWVVGSFFFSLFDLLKGRWWHALLLNQSGMVEHVRLLDDRFLAKEYLFNNSGWIYRPLWTYEAEKKGSSITLYFYSTNCEGVKIKNYYSNLAPGYGAMTWSRYLVWDTYQAHFVKRHAGEDANTIVVGSIWFSESENNEFKDSFKRPNIGVFDVSPIRKSFYSVLGQDNEYYTPQVANKFLTDISELIRQNDMGMVIKTKHKILRHYHSKNYFKFINRLSQTENISLVDYDISAHNLIEHCDVVISFPFTSTALIAYEIGKPTVYYDPTENANLKGDRAAHGITVISGRAELESWILKYTKLTA